MKLYYSPGACSLASHIVLHEIGRPFAIERVDLKSKRTETGADYNAINPKGYVPAIAIEDGVNLTEGAAILQHLADSFPEAGLAPRAGSLERARLNELLTFISSEVHKGFSPLFNPDAEPSVRAAATAKLNARLAFAESLFADGRTYLTGEAFTVADAYLFTVLNWAGFVKFDMASFPNLQAYHGRVAARAAVQTALKAEGLAA